MRDCFEFHISRRARDAYNFGEKLFSTTGRVIFADFYAARVFAQALNAKRPPAEAIRASQINALGLINELQHAVLRAYREQKSPNVMQDAVDWLAERLGAAEVEAALRRFVDEFPPTLVYKKNTPADEYLGGASAPEPQSPAIPHRLVAFEEMLVLWLTNMNPAASPLWELFDDTVLAETTAYTAMMNGLGDFFAQQPRFGPENQTLIDFLRTPALVAPDSLYAQLVYMSRRWGFVLGPLLNRLLSGIDFLNEEEKFDFEGPGPARLPGLGPGIQDASLALFVRRQAASAPRPPEDEPERYSSELDWMPRLVLIAKNAYVWLDQISKKYGRGVSRLDGIPDAELDELRKAGITGLWLIGIWERSPASCRIKQMMGNPEAAASAYSLYDYVIAEDLGGEEALRSLQERAFKRGIRLAADMVPNHMGVDSRWVIDNPDWFISSPISPFPLYTFEGADLSSDPRVSIQIEDHYYDQTDAAVVFKRMDRKSGDVRYIYHGNDGTSFPWNDTAQLDYLKGEVREAVVQTILKVARLFPIIRFDAAMTLAKRHFQRLWYPDPGTGGAIPSRAELGMTRSDFDASFPEEFWRQLVDRAAVEASDTLLLAEAFWLMEGYFVRTLGMHRVYNSAFMNMLRDEDNAKFRQVLKNTLVFDPEVLKRYVNFMSNPDERTAIEQYGEGDKYFGICTLMATLPGLPMVGHGQIQGFTEKYGMEYRRAYQDETPRGPLVERHAHDIFPLFHKRMLFAGVDNFLLYDFFTPEGGIDENVFAFSNAREGERALVVYHNKYAETSGGIRVSTAFSAKDGRSDNKVLARKELRDGLGLPDDPNIWIIFKDLATGQEYIRNSHELCEKGFYMKLGAYQCRVFLNIREVHDDEQQSYKRLAEELRGAGVASIEDAVPNLRARPIQAAFGELVHPGFFKWLLDKRSADADAPLDPDIGRQIEAKAEGVREAVHSSLGAETAPSAGDAAAAYAAAVKRDFESVMRLPALIGIFPKLKTSYSTPASRYFHSLAATPGTLVKEEVFAAAALFSWAALRSLPSLLGVPAELPSLIAEWRLDRIVADTLRGLGIDENTLRRTVRVLPALARAPRWFEPQATMRETLGRLIRLLFEDPEYRRALLVNTHQGVEYFNRESYEVLLWGLAAIAWIGVSEDPGLDREARRLAVIKSLDVLDVLLEMDFMSGYRVDAMTRYFKESPDSPESDPKA